MSDILSFYREWTKERKRLRAWTFVGFKIGMANTVTREGDEIPGGKRRQVHALFERGDGKRKVQTTGPDLTTPHAIDAKARVLAWRDGGPVPDMTDEADEPAPKPSKPKPITKEPAKLLVFTGGKGDAA